VKKLLAVLLTFMLVGVLFTGCKTTQEPSGDTGAKYHIGVVTGTVSQSEETSAVASALSRSTVMSPMVA